MRRRQVPGILLVLLVVVVLLVAALARHRSSPPPLVPHGVRHHAVFGPQRPVPPGLLGVNGEAIVDTGMWTDPRFLAAVAALHPEAIRVFGGTPANFWNWRAGTYVHARRIPSTLAALRSHLHMTLADWARLVRVTGATPVFDLNLLTSSLPSQLAMLHAARRLGMPISEVELGNELYLPTYAVRFHSGAEYGRVASRWIAAIRRAFPGVLVAADAYPGRDTNTATVDRHELRWNAEMLRTLRGESALSLHAYFASGLGPRASLASPAAAEKMLRAPTRRWDQLARLIARLPKVEIWVTEWNLFDTVARVHGTWAQGLAVVVFGLDLMGAPRVVQGDYETLVNSAPFGAIFGSTAGLAPPSGSVTFRAVSAHAPNTPLFGLATGGVAMEALLRALAGATVARPVSFRSAPVHGIVLGGKAGLGAVIVNLARRSIAISVPRPLRGLPYSESYARPITLVAGAATLHDETGTTSAAVELAPFSLLTIGHGSAG